METFLFFILLIACGILGGAAVISLISSILHFNNKNTSSGFVTLSMAILFGIYSLICYDTLCKFPDEPHEHKIKVKATQVSIDTTYVITNNKADTIYTINYIIP